MATHPNTSTVAREVRFATVMYGGVSLAIYINGMTQELLHLVRSTASRLTDARSDTGEALLGDAHLRGAEAVYRRIGQLVNGAGEWDPGRVVQWKGERWEPAPADEAVSPAAPITTRFIVDILSGTSAGGINAIFLAKALATGTSIDSLAQLWVDEGDIERLLNDRHAGSRDHDRRELPASLLNSPHMYRKLVDAFDDMDDRREQPPVEDRDLPRVPPLVPEVDLFVTTTDIRGLPIALRLADGVVAERRHRNVFHFRFDRDDGQHAPACNDFTAAENPFLAFAARCTSAFPFAFEPMTLGDLDRVLPFRGTRSAGARIATDGGARWRRFFPAYTGARELPGSADDVEALAVESRGAAPWLRDGGDPIAQRAFGDGGYLDNKPFEYAIDAIAGRRAELPVDRKLIYLEPSPEHPELDRPSDARPNAIENVAASLSLARYEAIRGDLQRVLARNRLVERVERIVRGVDDDLTAAQRSGRQPIVDWTGPEFEACDVGDMIARFGGAYGGYHRLKVSMLTDEISEYVSRVAGYDENSDEFEAVRHLVGAWRADRYAAYLTRPAAGAATPADKRESESAFLLRYDLNYRIRRLNFVVDRAHRLLCMDAGAKALLKRRGVDPSLLDDPACRAGFEATLVELRGKLTDVLHSLRDRRFALLSRDRAANPLTASRDAQGRVVVGDLPVRLTRQQMLHILEPATPDERTAAAWKLVEGEGLAPALDALEARIGTAVGEATRPASKACVQILEEPESAASDAGGTTARTLLHDFYREYDQYDQLIFPAFFSTGVGEETDVVDVVRMSPEDAPSLIDERSLAERRRKLAGITLGHFGAFVERSWRWNDILWGRLDAAERLITTLLPGGSDHHRAAREALVAEAHRAILDEEFRKKDADGAFAADRAARETVDRLRAAPAATPAAEREELRERLRQHVRRSYEVNRTPDPRRSANSVARGTHIVGRMFERMSHDYAVLGKPAAWLTRAGGIAWGVVEVASPQSLSQLAGRYWFKLLYAFEALLIGIGAILDRPMMKTGLTLLGITLTAHFLVLSLGDVFARRSTWWKRLAAVAAIALAIVLGLGALVLLSSPVRAAALAALGGGMASLGVGARAMLIGLALCAVLAGGIYMDARRRGRLHVNEQVATLQRALKDAESRRER